MSAATKFRSAFSLVILIAVPAPAASQLPAPTAGLAVYDSEVGFDLPGGTVSGRTVMRILADETRTDSVAFRIAPGIEIRRVGGPGVTGFRSTTLAFRTEHVVYLTGIEPGGIAELEIEFAGAPIFPESRINEISEAWVQLSFDSGWHPEPVGPRFVAGVVRIALPESWTVVGSGETRFEGGAHVLRNTLPLPDVPFTAGPALSRRGTDRFTVFHTTERAGDVPLVLEAADACETFLNGHFGGSSPLPHVRFVLGTRSRSTFFRRNFAPLSPLAGSTPAGVLRYLCHELAHIWSTSSGVPAEHWMSEAFAEYVAGMALRRHFGQEAFQRFVATRVENGRGHGPVWTPELTRRVPDPAMYGRAPAILAELEQRIGEERFLRFVQAYMGESIATTQRLLDVLAEIAGPDEACWLRVELMKEGDG